MSTPLSLPLADRIAGLAGEIRPESGVEGRSFVQQGVEAVLVLAIQTLLAAIARLAKRFADGLVPMTAPLPVAETALEPGPETAWPEAEPCAVAPAKKRGFFGWLGNLWGFGPGTESAAIHARESRLDAGCTGRMRPAAARAAGPLYRYEAVPEPSSVDVACHATDRRREGETREAQRSWFVRPMAHTPHRRCRSAARRGWPAATAGPSSKSGWIGERSSTSFSLRRQNDS